MLEISDNIFSHNRNLIAFNQLSVNELPLSFNIVIDQYYDIRIDIDLDEDGCPLVDVIKEIRTNNTPRIANHGGNEIRKEYPSDNLLGLFSGESEDNLNDIWEMSSNE